MSIIPKLLKSRQRFPKPLANWDFGDASKIQEGATAVDVAGWTDSQVTNQRASGNLVTNGTFDTDLSDWTHGAGGWAWDSGKAKLTGNGSAQPLSQAGVFTIGTFYEIHFDVDVTVGAFDIGVQDGSGSIIPQLSGSSGTIVGVWRADTANLTFKRQSGTLTATLDNIKAYELNSNTVAYDLAQTTAAAQSVFSTDHIVLDGTDFLDGMPPQLGDFTYIVKFMSTSSATQVLLGSSTIISEFILLTSNTVRYKSSLGINNDLPLIFDNTGPHTLFIVKSGTLVSIYNAGSLLGSFTDAGSIDLDWLGDRTTNDLGFIGKIFKTLIYPSALTATEVAAKTASLA